MRLLKESSKKSPLVGLSKRNHHAILVISDIQRKLSALEAVMASVVNRRRRLVPRDLVGYGPFPNECIETDCLFTESDLPVG